MTSPEARPDVFAGLSLADALRYREQCQENLYNAMDYLAAATLALAGINNHIQLFDSTRL